MTDINTPTGGNEELKSRLEGLTPEQKDELLEILKKDKLEREKSAGNVKAILEDLRENYVKIEENAEMMGYKGKKININLPAVGKFKGFNFDYFVSDESIRKEDFENTLELQNKSYSMKEVGELLGAMNKYMQAMGVETDGDINYENDLKYWKTMNYKCNAGDYLKELLGLNYWYWLNDKNIKGIKNSYIEWDCHDYCCRFYIAPDANLFLKLSN